MKRIFRKSITFFVLATVCVCFAGCDGEELSDKLSTPANVKIENGVLLWDEVAYADGYSISINGSNFSAETCQYDLSALKAGVYDIKVQAKSNRQIANSEFTETEYIVPTEGLEYRLSQRGESEYYSLQKLAVDEYGACIIPPTHDGKPVYCNSASVVFEKYESASLVKTLYIPYFSDDEELKSFLDPYLYTGYANLESFRIGEGSKRYFSEGNCVVDKQEATLLIGCVNCVIPSYVQIIGAGAFRGRNIINLTVPERITKIGRDAFSNCSALENIVLPSRLTGSTANRSLIGVFSGCTSLKEVNIPEGTYDLTGTFRNCTSLGKIVIPRYVKTLDETFSGCTSLKEASIANSVQSMKFTFNNCSSLQTVNIPTGVDSLIGTFMGCTSLQSIAVPKNVKSLLSTFSNCTSLKTVDIADGVTQIGRYTDWNASSVETAYYPAAFENCSSLSEITLPSTLTYLSRAFIGCTMLKSIAIPDKLSTLSGEAFSNCTSLISIVLPKTINVNNYSFWNSPLEEVYYKGTEADWNEKLTVAETGNEAFLSATRYYYSETAPEGKGNFWRYVDGVPEKWA